jgi:hypothetical protein
MAEDPRSELEATLAAHAETPFPRSSEDETLSDLHADLVEYDGHVAGVATTLLEGQPVPPEFLRFPEDLRERIADAAESSDPGHAEQARAYLAYLDELRRVLEAARRVTAGGSAGSA